MALPPLSLSKACKVEGVVGISIVEYLCVIFRRQPRAQIEKYKIEGAEL